MDVLLKSFAFVMCTCVVISSCMSRPVANENESNDPSYEKIEKEIARFDILLGKIIDSKTDNAFKMQNKGTILGKLEELLKMKKKAEFEVDELKIEMGRRIERQDDADKFRLLLGLPHRVDSLESTLAPGVDFSKTQRRKRWQTIFKLNNQKAADFRKKVESAGITADSFAENVEQLCDEGNKRARTRILMPRMIKEKTIEEALEMMGIYDDEDAAVTFKMLAALLQGPDLTKPTKNNSK